MRKCINCSWEGEEPIKPHNTCPVCGDNTEDMGGDKSSKLDMDLNNDGVVDKKDRTIAAKVLASGRRKKR